MVAILLAALGIPLWLVIVLALLLLRQRRWVRSRPGTFTCAMRRAAGDPPGSGEKWRRGYALWVRDVLSFRSNRSLDRDSLLAVDGLGPTGVRPALRGEVRRLGPEPLVISLQIAGDGVVEMAVRAEDRGPAVGPFEGEMVRGLRPEAQEPAPAV